MDLQSLRGRKMIDKELLELAAKAAGYDLVWGEEYFIGKDKVDCTDMPYIKSKDIDELDCYWNPLTDDGDALRLVVKLKMDIVYDFDRVMVVYGDGDATLTTEYFYDLPTPTDQYAATRRAIVKAAAEIGKSL